MNSVRFVRGRLRAILLIAVSSSIPLLGGRTAVCSTDDSGRAEAASGQTTGSEAAAEVPQSAELREELKHVPYRIVFESYDDNHWGLKMMRADGSDGLSLTQSGTNELYPHVSPDGKKLCYLVDEGEGQAKSRNVYYRNLDGTGRRLVVTNGRDPCWTSDGRAIVYTKGEVAEFTCKDYASTGLFTYNLATGKHLQHPREDISHLYNVCCSADDKWFVATVHAAMGFAHGNVSIEAQGRGVFDLGIPGCRPDVSRDGTKIAWGASDCELRVGDLNVPEGKPKVVNMPHDSHQPEADTHLSHRLVAGRQAGGVRARSVKTFDGAAAGNDRR